MSHLIQDNPPSNTSYTELVSSEKQGVESGIDPEVDTTRISPSQPSVQEMEDILNWMAGM